MAFQVSQREAAAVQQKKCVCLFRAHERIHFPVGTKVPLVLRQDGKSPFGIQVVGAAEFELREIDDATAKSGGFRDRKDFLQHWRGPLYGPDGFDPSGDDRLRDTCKVVGYRFKVAEVVQKRLTVTQD